MPSDLPIVGIGASAGGVEALEQFFRSVPADNRLAFVVVTHLLPNRESMLSEILGRVTTMPVVEAQDDQAVEAEHVYVLPPGAILAKIAVKAPGWVHVTGDVARARAGHAGTLAFYAARMGTFYAEQITRFGYGDQVNQIKEGWTAGGAPYGAPPAGSANVGS